MEKYKSLLISLFTEALLLRLQERGGLEVGGRARVRDVLVEEQTIEC